MQTESRDYMISNKLYDCLKSVALVILPGIGALYFTLSSIWGLPAAEEVLGTVTALGTFIGVLLRASTKSYDNSENRHDGTIDVLPTDEGGIRYSLNLKDDPELIANADAVSFKINPPS